MSENKELVLSDAPSGTQRDLNYGSVEHGEFASKASKCTVIHIDDMRKLRADALGLR